MLVSHLAIWPHQPDGGRRLMAGGRFPASKMLPYSVTQVVGDLVAGGVLRLLATQSSTSQRLAGICQPARSRPQ